MFELNSYYKAILDNTTDNILLLDPEFKVLCFNEAIRLSTLMLNKRELSIGDDYLQAIPPHERELFLESFEKVLKGNTIDVEYETVYENYSFWYRYKLNPVYNHQNELLGVALTAINIDQQKKTELEKQEMVNNLLQRNRDLEQFVYMASHNIRAPIATMLGLSVLLESGVDGEDKDFAWKGLRKSIENLDFVLKDLSDLIQVKRESAESKSVIRFDEVLRSVIESLKGNVNSSGAMIQSDFKAADSILSIRSFIYNIFFNLISNAIKYQREGITPEINIWTERSGSRIILYIQDNGRGIDMSKHGDELFGLYKRFSQDVEGKGLGLFLVKTQVDTMNGSISAESEVGKGTSFKIIIPDPH